MSERPPSPIARRLASRVRRLGSAEPVRYRDDPVPDTMRRYLADHLAGGETHYTTRPGIVSLRRRVGELLAAHGAPARREEGVVITASEGESLFVTLLSLGARVGDAVVTARPSRHQRLLDLMGIRTVRPDDPAGGRAVATVSDGGDGAGSSPAAGLHIVALGDAIARADAGRVVAGDASEEIVLIGSLGAMASMDHFHVGFVAGPPVRMKGVMTWKQALSICTAAPSQRAAVLRCGAEDR